jgi:uncharacterized lipoprotein YddW (UPF0748 family)
MHQLYSRARVWRPAALIVTLTLVAVAALTACRSHSSAPTAPPVQRPTAVRAAPRPLPATVRAIWVARFHYRNADDIRTIIANCAAVGANTVLWQVRGEGTVAYPSRLEPWSREYNFRDPGFDPLAVAVAEAHRHGLRIEAWFNVMPGWKGRTPPPTGQQMYNAHPDWFMYDAAGHRQPLHEDYVIVNPCLPDVRRHIVEVVDEIASRYDIDGLHLDYVRYAWDGAPNAKQAYPHDARTVSLFQRETGARPEDNATTWNNWRANQLTRLVVSIRSTLTHRRPGATLTAAVWRDPYVGFRDYLQNSVAWLRSGVVDAVMPMAYSEKSGDFQDNINAYRRLAGDRRIVPGLGIYLHKRADDTAAQLEACRQWSSGYALFSYESIFATAADRASEPSAEVQRLRYARRGVVRQYADR